MNEAHRAGEQPAGFDPSAIAEEMEQRLDALGRPERAAGEKRYLKSDLAHLGASVPAIRNVAATVAREHPAMCHDGLVALVDALWARPVHERRMAAVELLALGTGELTIADVALLERLLREARTWALVDPLAITVVGALVDEQPAAWDAVLRRWAADDDKWLRRAALLAHLPALRRGAGSFERFAELADACLGERDFFIRKAIGWVLRETGRQRPDLVTSWLLPRAARSSGVTVREAVRYLPETDRQQILGARD